MSGTRQAQLFFLCYKPNNVTERTSLVLFCGIKRTGWEICHLQPSSAEVRHAQSYASNPSLVWWRFLNLAKKNYILVHQCTNLVSHEIQKIEDLTSESAVYQNCNLHLFWVNFSLDIFTEKPIENGQYECDCLESLIANWSWHTISLNYSRKCISLVLQIHTCRHPTLGANKPQNFYSH